MMSSFEIMQKIYFENIIRKFSIFKNKSNFVKQLLNCVFVRDSKTIHDKKRHIMYFVFRILRKLYLK